MNSPFEAVSADKQDRQDRQGDVNSKCNDGIPAVSVLLLLDKVQMRASKKLTFYILMIMVFGLLIWWIAQKDTILSASAELMSSGTFFQHLKDGFGLFSKLTSTHIQSTIGILLLQIIVILATCRLVALLFKKIGQPAVIGEILAGILLGPSVLGYFFPFVSGFLFPEASLSNIKMLSQFGLILFMYIIGMELDLSMVRKRLQDTIIISHTSTIVPFFLGMLVAYFIFDAYALEETSFLAFALFIGISLSITAFPVLARIIQERGMTRTHLGTIALSSAANGDITAWCLLAAVVAYAQAGTMNSAIYIILFSGIYIVVMFFLVRPVLRVIGDLYYNKEVMSKPLVALMFFILLLSSYITELLGLHALFGAFIAGLIMPENFKFRKIMNEKIEDVALSIFLPLFFVYTGLHTKIGLIQGAEMWLLCGAFILVAIIGKFGSTIIAARVSKESWKNSLYLGAFMNTRGLMELVVLSIGLEMKILPPAIFVMLVLMTLVTTFMTSPLLAFINVCFRASERLKYLKTERLKTDSFKLLLSFGRKSNSQAMLNLAHQMFSMGEKKLDITALHLTVGSDVNPVSAADFEKENFEPVLYDAGKLHLNITTRYDVCNNAVLHICSIVNNENFDFLLVGAGVSMSVLETDVKAVGAWRKLFGTNQPPAIFSPGALIRDKTKEFVEKSRCSVGVFVNRGFVRANHILVIINNENDLFLLSYVKTLHKTTRGLVQLMNHAKPNDDAFTVIENRLSDYLTTMDDTAVTAEKTPTRELLGNADLMLVSYQTWQVISKEYDHILQNMPSTLIIKNNRTQ